MTATVTLSVSSRFTASVNLQDFEDLGHTRSGGSERKDLEGQQC